MTPDRFDGDHRHSAMGDTCPHCGTVHPLGYFSDICEQYCDECGERVAVPYFAPKQHQEGSVTWS